MLFIFIYSPILCRTEALEGGKGKEWGWVDNCYWMTPMISVLLAVRSDRLLD